MAKDLSYREDLYKMWKNKKIEMGYTHPSEITEKEFKIWMYDQIADMY